jgi:hypothetical protein
MLTGRVPVVGEDPRYQRIKNELSTAPSNELEAIVKTFEPVYAGREKNTLLASILPIIPFSIGLAAYCTAEHLGLKVVANQAAAYGVGTAMATWAFVTMPYYASRSFGRREREEHRYIAAEALLSERKDNEKKAALFVRTSPSQLITP